jgi:hypothetical protein
MNLVWKHMMMRWMCTKKWWEEGQEPAYGRTGGHVGSSWSRHRSREARSNGRFGRMRIKQVD